MVDVVVDQFGQRIGVDLTDLAADFVEAVVAAELAAWNRAAILIG